MSDLYLARHTHMSYDEVRRLPREVYDVLVEIVNRELTPAPPPSESDVQDA